MDIRHFQQHGFKIWLLQGQKLCHLPSREFLSKKDFGGGGYIWDFSCTRSPSIPGLSGEMETRQFSLFWNLLFFRSVASVVALTVNSSTEISTLRNNSGLPMTSLQFSQCKKCAASVVQMFGVVLG